MAGQAPDGGRPSLLLGKYVFASWQKLKSPWTSRLPSPCLPLAPQPAPCKTENMVLRMRHQIPCQRLPAPGRALGSLEGGADCSGPPSPCCIITSSCPVLLGTMLCHRPVALHPRLLLQARSVTSFSLCPSVHLTNRAFILCHGLGWNCRHRGE